MKTFNQMLDEVPVKRVSRPDLEAEGKMVLDCYDLDDLGARLQRIVLGPVPVQ
jgi:hypothetical protein